MIRPSQKSKLFIYSKNNLNQWKPKPTRGILIQIRGHWIIKFPFVQIFLKVYK